MQPENNMQNGASGPKLEAVVEEVTAMETKPVATEPSKSDIVFNDKPKKNSSMILGMVLLAILAIGGIGFGVWAMLDGNQKATTLNNQIASLQQQNDELMEKIDKTPVSDDTTINISTDAVNAWQNFSKSLINRPMIAQAGYWHYTGSDNVYNLVSAYKDAEGRLKINKNGTDMLVDSIENVLLVYGVHYGQGADECFYMVKADDGSVYKMEISENMTNEIEKVGDYTNIISVFQDGDLSIDLVDINGNLYQTK